MVYNDLNKIFEKCGWNKIQVNTWNVMVHYNIKYETAYVIVSYDLKEVKFSLEWLEHITSQIITKFTLTYNKVEVLNILCTDKVEIAKPVASIRNDIWIVDTNNNRLIIYENQPNDFLFIRKYMDLALDNNTNYQPPAYNSFNVKMDKSSILKFINKIPLLLVILNIVVFLVVNFSLLGGNSNFFLVEGSVNWRAILYEHEYYRLITYMFLHSGFEHLINNMLILYVLGDYLEQSVGKVKFSIVYFLSGIIAGTGSMVYNRIYETNVISVGASGAIFGIIGAMVFMVIKTKGKLRTISKRQMIIFAVLSLYSGFTEQNIDNIAHIVGFIAGVLITAMLYKKPRKKEEMNES